MVCLPPANALIVVGCLFYRPVSAGDTANTPEQEQLPARGRHMINTPALALDSAMITFFNQLVFDTPLLRGFFGRTEMFQ
jgi:hypothetical protein